MTLNKMIRRLALAAVFAGLAGCATAPQQPAGPAGDSVGAEPVISAPAPATPQPVIRTPRVVKPAPEPVEPPQRKVAIILSAGIDAYADVADALTLGLARHEVFNLNGRADNIPSVLAAVRDADADQVVAIGLLAARAARRIEGKDVVFCQVFNYADHGLLDADMRGVNTLPPFSLQVKLWKSMSPGLASVGLISGPGQGELVAEAAAAAREHGLKMQSLVVSSDKEALYAYRRLLPEIQGLWLLPDNRILSPSILRRIMAYSGKHEKQVAVFNHGLLDLGALVSFAAAADDIATQVIAVLSGEHAAPDSPRVAPLTRVDLKVNGVLAERMGVSMPDDIRGIASR